MDQDFVLSDIYNNGIAAINFRAKGGGVRRHVRGRLVFRLRHLYSVGVILVTLIVSIRMPVRGRMSVNAGEKGSLNLAMLGGKSYTYTDLAELRRKNEREREQSTIYQVLFKPNPVSSLEVPLSRGRYLATQSAREVDHGGWGSISSKVVPKDIQ